MHAGHATCAAHHRVGGSAEVLSVMQALALAQTTPTGTSPTTTTLRHARPSPHPSTHLGLFESIAETTTRLGCCCQPDLLPKSHTTHRMTQV